MTDTRRLIAELDDEVNMGHLENVQRLLEQGADANGRNIVGDTPLMTAAHTGQAEMVLLLLQSGADTEARNRDGKTATELAQQIGHQDVLSVFAE